MSRNIDSDFTQKVIDKMEQNGEFQKPVKRVEHDDNGNPSIETDFEECKFEEVEDEQKDMFIGYLDVMGEAIIEVVTEELGE